MNSAGQMMKRGDTRIKTTACHASHPMKLRVHLLENNTNQHLTRQHDPRDPFLLTVLRLSRWHGRGLLLSLLFRMNGRVHLTAVDGDFLWGLNPQPDLVTPNLHHRDDDRIVDHDAFVLFARKNQHCRVISHLFGEPCNARRGAISSDPTRPRVHSVPAGPVTYTPGIVQFIVGAGKSMVKMASGRFYGLRAASNR
jgi:hypothetical protein